MSEKENLKALIERVLAKASAEAGAATERAQKGSEREIGQAEAQARKRLAAAEAVLREAAQERRYSRQADVQQAERRALMNEREAAVAAVFGAALEALSVIGDATQRRDLLVELIGQGIAVVGSPSVRVRLNAAELALAQDPVFPQEINGAALTLDPEPLQCSGGPIVSDEAGRIVFENTFEARLERARESLRRQVAHDLQLSDGEGE